MIMEVLERTRGGGGGGGQMQKAPPPLPPCREERAGFLDTCLFAVWLSSA